MTYKIFVFAQKRMILSWFAKECWIPTHNLTDLQLGDIDRGDWTKFYTGGGELHPEVQPLALLYTSFDRKITPFESHFVNITNDTPFTYRKLSCLFHSYKIHLLGPSADTNDRFPYLTL